MQSPLSRYLLLVRRWAWLALLGALICGVATYVVSSLLPPVYRASSMLIINVDDSSSSPYDNISASQLAATTYAQLVKSPVVLGPVLAAHPDLTSEQLNAMVSAKPQPDTSLIELDVENGDPAYAAELANEISQNFAAYVLTQLVGTVKIVGAEVPPDPIRPKPLLYSGIGLLVGLCLGTALAIIFEWADDRLAAPDEAEKLLGTETLAVLPRLRRRQRNKPAGMVPDLAETSRMICAALNAAQGTQPCKLVLFTSALPGEGKTIVAANAAAFLAKANKRVLLVDAHLRQPRLAQYVHLGGAEGCAGPYLETWKRLTNGSAQQANGLPTLCVLAPGRMPPANSADLFLSPLAQQFLQELANAPFDYVLFDAAPLLPVADAQMLAVSMQAAVLVINASKTSRKELERAWRLLNRGHVKVLGAVINRSRWPKARASRCPAAWRKNANRRALPPAGIAPTGQAAAPNFTAPVPPRASD